MDLRKIVVTSALPYANGDIHIGHLVEYLQTDFWVRFQKMCGHECIYVCADDTHGTPVMIRARQEGITPEALIADSHEKHCKDFADFGIEFDSYYSTHSEENREFSSDIFRRMNEGGHISTRTIPQLYCENDAMFLPDRFVTGICPNCASEGEYGDSCDACGASYNVGDLKSPQCSICGASPVLRDSEHLFFELNHYKEYLQQWLPTHTARDVANKLLEWFDEDLRAWDISRDAPYFGFEIPGHPGKFFYVWVDAPIGYMASLKRWCDANSKSFDEYWNDPAAELYHFIGKDIARFHCLFWPAMLKAADYKSPDKVFVHGFLTVNGEKMSKSKGTFITARTYLDNLDAQYMRYYYACKLNSSSDDMALSFDDFVQRVNSDLVGKITNLASRGAQMISKRLEGRMGRCDEEGMTILRDVQAAGAEVARQYEAREFGKAMVMIRDIADRANQYFDAREPWKSIKTDPEQTRSVLTSVLNIFRVMAIYLRPVLPEYSDKVALLFGEEPYSWADAGKVLEEHSIGKYSYLAKRVERNVVDKIAEDARTLYAEVTAVEDAVAEESAVEIEPIADQIDFDTFLKVDLRVAEVLEAACIEEADKLLRLKVGMGGETREIIAGIRKAYDPAKLVGRRIVIVANLKPRKMRFGVSEGMVLACGEGGSDLFLLSPDDGAKPGQRIG